MNEIAITDIGVPVNTGKGISRKSIINFEQLMRDRMGPAAEYTDDLCPITHSFSDGIYIREMFAPKGAIIVGKIINQEHHIFLMSGEIIILTEQGQKTFIGPIHFNAPAGTKRVGYVVEDIVWCNIHPNLTNTINVDKIEKKVISPSYKHYDRLVRRKTGFVNKIKYSLIKILS